MEIVAADIGGTHARFAIAEVADRRVVSLGQTLTVKTADHASLQTAWEAFARESGRPLPKAAGLAVAAPIAGGLGLKLADILPHSGFGSRFMAKGRFEHRMAVIPVKLVTHPQPGLFGAAAAFAEGHAR